MRLALLHVLTENIEFATTCNDHLSGVPGQGCCAVVPDPLATKVNAQVPPLCQLHCLKNPWIFLQKILTRPKVQVDAVSHPLQDVEKMESMKWVCLKMAPISPKCTK